MSIHIRPYNAVYFPIVPLTSFLSAEDVADELGLHVRTIRAYIRDGRLRAARVGKQYRITRADLAAFVAGAGTTGDGSTDAQTARQPLPDATVNEHSTVVVDLDNLKPGDWDRVATVLTAAAGGRDRRQPLRLTTAPGPDGRTLKVIAQGSISDTADVLILLRDLTEGGNFT
jgi:excisionase family DNA binding protein